MFQHEPCSSHLVVSTGLSLGHKSLALLCLGLRAVLEQQLEKGLGLVLVEGLGELVERCR